MRLNDKKKNGVLLTIISFNGHAEVMYNTKGLPTEEELTKLKKWLVAEGGTDISLALSKALDVALPSVGDGVETTVVFITDGDDTTLARDFSYQKDGATLQNANGALFKRLGSLPSGLHMVFLAVCRDADAILLEGLAALANGTFSSIDEGDIKGTMGSLYGLNLERISNTVTLEVVRVSDAPGMVGSKLLLMPCRSISLRKNMVLKIPLVIPHTLDGGGDKLVARVCVMHVGAVVVVGSPSWEGGDRNVLFPRATSVTVEQEIVKTLQLLQPAQVGGLNIDVAVGHAAVWRNAASKKVLEALEVDDYAVAESVYSETVARVKALVSKIEAAFFPPPPSLVRTDSFSDSVAYYAMSRKAAAAIAIEAAVGAAVEAGVAFEAGVEAGAEAGAEDLTKELQDIITELESKAVSVAAARGNWTAMREFVHNEASNASTARNGIAFGDGRTESFAQQYGRTMSQSMSF